MRALSLAIAALCLAACRAPAPGASLPPPPPHPNGQALWRIVHGACVPDEQANRRPDPCIEVDLTGGVARGWAVLKDMHGAEQYLVMPTIEVTGIEDGRLLRPGAPNYFAAAWRARHYVEAKIGEPVPREDMAVSVNSPYGRSQDLLHLHVDCLTPRSAADLAVDAPRIGWRWSRAPVTLDGHPYYAVRLAGADPTTDPFHLLAAGIPGAARDMGAWTLVLAGSQWHGRPGFILLAGPVDLAHGDHASGEELQDHDCRIARASGVGS